MNKLLRARRRPDETEVELTSPRASRRRALSLWPALLCLFVLVGCSSEEAAAPPTSGSADRSAHDSKPAPTAPIDDPQEPSALLTEIQPLRRQTPDDPSLLPPPPESDHPLSDDALRNGRTAEAPQPYRSEERPVQSAAKRPFTTVRVFYGTNRMATGSSHPKQIYGTRRGETTYGFCDVSIPRGHRIGELESPSIWRFEFREDPEKHVVLLRVLRRSRDAFVAALQQKVWSSMQLVDTPEGPALAGGEVFIFVHGYNNTFEDAARRAAQIAYDLKFPGAPVMYSWPSQARASLEAYRVDGQMAGWSEEHLIDFVSTVARDSGARRVHLIAHSMGNRIVSGALRRLVEQCVSGRLPKFNEVILSAPDVDAEYFKVAIAPRIVHSADRITIYSSSRDYALKMSSFFNPQARRRLGEAGKELTLFPEFDNIDVIDATEVETDLFALNHSYHSDSPSVLSDMALLLRGYTTEQRGLASVFNRLAWQIRNVGRQLGEGLTPARR